MASKVSGSSDSFDLEKLRELVEMMEEHGLTEVSLRHGEEHWRLRRGDRDAAPPTHAVVNTETPETTGSSASNPSPTDPDDSVCIKSPTVGTFYASPSPDEPSFVTVGSKVQADTVVCIVEAMKVFNQIPAEVSGKIVAVLMENGEPVEFGQPVFKVDTRE